MSKCYDIYEPIPARELITVLTSFENRLGTIETEANQLKRDINIVRRELQQWAALNPESS